MTVQSALCAEFCVQDIVVDSSDRMIFIKGKGNYKNNLQTIEVPTPGSNSIRLINNITSFTISSPSRYVIDIPNAALEGANRTYKIQNSTVLNSVQLAQFSTNPHYPLVPLL